MLILETNYGNFGNFKNIILFMREEHLESIEITKVEYCLQEIFGKGTCTINEVETLIKMMEE